jgi:hypothetical protein
VRLGITRRRATKKRYAFSGGPDIRRTTWNKK